MAEQGKKMSKKRSRYPSIEHEILPMADDEQLQSYLQNSDSNSDQEIISCMKPEGKRSRYQSPVDGKSSGASMESELKWDKIREEEDDSDVEYKALKAELSSLSFEELQKVQEKIGLKVFNQLMYGNKSKSALKKNFNSNKKFKRENKNRPMETSSKIRVPRVRQAMPVKKKTARDPRFDDLSGQYNETFFKDAYSFLDDVKAREKEKVKLLLKKEKDEEKKKNMLALVNRMNQQEQSRLQKNKQTELLNEWKKKEEVRVREGKNPYFLKKSDKKMLVLAEKYKELKKSGKMEKYLNKKRKKNAQKERKKLPERFEL